MQQYEVLPEAAEAAKEADQVATRAAGIVIRDADDYRIAGEERTRIKQRYNEIEDLRKRLKQPILDAARNVDDQFREPLARLSAAQKQIDDEAKRYLAEVEAARRAEEARQREIARKEAERLAELARVEAAKAEELRQKAAAAAEAGKLAEAAKLEARADVAVERSEETEQRSRSVPTPIVKSTAPRSAGLSTREHWAFEVVNSRDLPREYLVPNEAAIRAVVNSLKGNTAIPGVRVWRDDIVSGRGR